MRILIVRHAEPDYVHDSLTEKGKREAELLGKRLSQIDASAYYVSPLGRARETASYTLRMVGKEAVTLPWLAEFRGYALHPLTDERRIPWNYHTDEWYDHKLLADRDQWTEDPLVCRGDVGRVWDETKKGIDALLRAHGYDRQGGTYRCANNKPETIILFCHFAIGAAILAYLTNLPPLPLWQGFLCLPSAVTTVVTQERRKGEVEFRCVSLGDVSHLLPEKETLSLAGLYPECYNGLDSTDPSEWPDDEKRPFLIG